jgi:hypothetical protein
LLTFLSKPGDDYGILPVVIHEKLNSHFNRNSDEILFAGVFLSAKADEKAYPKFYFIELT